MLESAVLQGSNVPKGKHRVRMLGLLPNISTVLATPEVEVDLQCSSDAGTPALVLDTGAEHDAGVERARNEGCTLGAPAGHAWLLALALLLRRRVHS